jgi:hypothetical protein
MQTFLEIPIGSVVVGGNKSLRVLTIYDLTGLTPTTFPLGLWNASVQTGVGVLDRISYQASYVFDAKVAFRNELSHDLQSNSPILLLRGLGVDRRFLRDFPSTYRARASKSGRSGRHAKYGGRPTFGSVNRKHGRASGE